MTTTTADKGEQECREAFERELLKKYPSAKNIKRADGTYIGHMQLLWEFWQAASSKNIVATKVLEDIKMALSPAPYNASYVEFAKECRQAWNRRPACEQQRTTNEGQEVLTDEDVRAIATAAYKSGELSWLGFDHDGESYCIPSLSPCHYQFARAIARHLSSKQEPKPEI